MMYDRNDIPASLTSNRRLVWKTVIDSIDLQFYLPLFVDGLQLKEQPYATIAYLGCVDLITKGKNFEQTFPSIIVPLKKSLNIKNGKIQKRSLKILQLIASTGKGGEEFIPYLRQVLPLLNRHYLGSLREEVEATLNLFVVYGGVNAYKNIKYAIPRFDYVFSIE